MYEALSHRKCAVNFSYDHSAYVGVEGLAPHIPIL